MSTENDLKKLNQTDSLTPIVSKLESFEEENKEKIKPVFNLKQWISTYRSTTRVNFGRNLVNFSTVLACLPVAVGFLDFLRLQMSSPRQYESIFQKTLPVFANLQPKLSYETFQYITGSNLELNSQKKGFILGRPHFLATFNQSNSQKTFLDQIKSNSQTSFDKKQFDLNSFSGFSCSFSSLSSGEFPILNSTDSAPQILDELPGYVQGLTSRGSKPGKNIPRALVKPKQNQSLQTNFSFSGDSNKLSKNSLLIPSNFCLDSVSPTRLRLLQKPQSYSLSTSVSLKKEFRSQQTDFDTNFNQLDKKVQDLFLNKQISLTFNDFLDSSSQTAEEDEIEKDFLQNSAPAFFKDFLTKNSHVDDNIIIDILLRNLEKQTISKDNEGFRFMSGYHYPDTTTQELSRFYKQREVFHSLFGKKEWLKNLFHFSSESYLEKQIVLGTKQYPFKIENLQPFAVQTQYTTIKSHETGETLYQGPSLVLDSETTFDWITRGNLRSWLLHYLSPLNPFSQNSENFFGLYESPFSSKQKSAILAFQDRSLFSTSFINQIKRSALVAPPLQSQFFPSRLSVFVSADSKSSANNFVRGIDSQLTEPKKEDLLSETDFLPIILSKQPYFKISSRKITDFRGYSSVFDIGLTGKSDYIYSLDLVTEISSKSHYSSGQYKKIPSSLSKSSAKRGVTNWEPLTANSWLIISQLSFAIFSFQILKNLADNYGRELLSYLLELIAALGFVDPSVKQAIENLMGPRKRGFRVFTKSSKTFKDIVGVQKFLPELYEVIWYLRNSARNFMLSDVLPRGILLTGPPGTGKTLLVQALAGEAGVPFIILSGDSLIEPKVLASTKLEMVFQEARQMAPCIVFIDEIDTLGPKRSDIVGDPMALDDIVEFLNSYESFNPDTTLERLEAEARDLEAKEKAKEAKKKGIILNPHEAAMQQLSLLTHLLSELDGIRGRDGVLVIGATNRLDSLDPALLRPGRFDQIIEVGLPDKQKRIDILKFYGEKFGYQANIPWNYLGERTVGFSAADLATIMNESALNAILYQKETVHTVQTIERGIDRLTIVESETEKPRILKLGAQGNLSIESKLLLLRFAYYQAGKVVVSSLLKEHPKSVFAALWPRCPNFRSLETTTNLQTVVFQSAKPSEIKARLVGCYAGKAAEFLFLEKFASARSSQRSTLGLEDILFGQTLVYTFLEKFFFYSKKSYHQQTITLPENINKLIYSERLERLPLYEEITDDIEYPPVEKAIEEALEEQRGTVLPHEQITVNDEWEPQVTYLLPWWLQEMSDSMEFHDGGFENFTRLYLESPERSFRNIEWRPYDEFYHTDTALKDTKNAVANISRQKIELRNSETVTEQKQQTPVEIEPQTGVSVSKLVLNEGDIKKETQNLEVESEIEIESSSENEMSETEKEAVISENVQEETQIESSSQRVKIPWRDQDKTQTSYPAQNVYISWNDVSALTRDYPMHSLILQSFNKALVILNQNRELVDRLVIDLLSQEILRQDDIEAVLQEFQLAPLSDQGEESSDLLEKPKEFEIVEADWGQYSRKPCPRWIDFAQFSKQTT